jgi:hypothetical protein
LIGWRACWRSSKDATNIYLAGVCRRIREIKAIVEHDTPQNASTAIHKLCDLVTELGIDVRMQ